MTFGRQLSQYAAREWRLVVPLVVVSIVSVSFEALLPWPLKLVVDNVLPGQPLPDALSWAAALPGASTQLGALGWLALSVLVLFVGTQALSIARGLLDARASARMQVRLGASVFEKLQALSLGFHRRARRGDLVRRVTADTSCVAVIVLHVALPLLTSTLLLAVLFAIMWQLDALLASVAALVTIPMVVLMRWFGPRMATRAYEHEQAASDVWSLTEQTLTALPVVQAFGREAHERSRFSGVAERSQHAYLRSLAAQLQFKIGISTTEAVGVGAVMLVGGIHVLQGSLSIGALIVFMSYVTALYAPLVALAYLASTSAMAIGNARRVMDVLESEEEVRDAHRARPLRRSGKHKGHVAMEAVEFGYLTGQPVLHSVDFEAQPGEMVALVGPTGAGKTSLVSLIPRLFDPWAGRVWVSGHEVRDVTLASLREAVSIVLQSPLILPVSVAENIAYARPGASHREIEAAARAANAHEFIEQLPQGYATVLGERGVNLSGGQRQRLAIAGALLKDAPILIMDEPTSALDPRSEAAVMEALARLRDGRTVIVIAHRLTTIRRADRVAVLDAGQVVENGSHDVLMARGGLYRKLYLGHLLQLDFADVRAAPSVPSE
jgi:ATP-binding cassette subfamily B protein/subfamily B ATP-binding cassette protein MsbA